MLTDECVGALVFGQLPDASGRKKGFSSSPSASHLTTVATGLGLGTAGTFFGLPAFPHGRESRGEYGGRSNSAIDG